MRRFRIMIFMVLVVGMFLLPPGLTCEVQAQSTQALYQEAEAALQDVVHKKDIKALVYLVDEYAVRKEPRYDSETVVTVSGGQTVLIKGLEVDSQEKPWIKVFFSVEDVEYAGYIEREYIVCSDEVFLEWEQEFAQEKNLYRYDDLLRVAADNEVPADIQMFPESYQKALLELKQAHPNWVFVKMDTGLSWNKVVTEELVEGRSLIPTSLGAHLTEGRHSNGWSYPTREALEYYLDPRNGLTENSVFQFELLSYNATYHEGCQAALQSFLDNTFMKGIVPQWVETYAYAFWIIGREMNISPFHLASRVYQEQGNGTSPLISGTYPGYEGYYNYFNIGASGTTEKQVIESGLEYAKNANPPWTTPYYSLHFGSEILGSSYILKGQDTLYLQKFDVDDSYSGMFWHQYMQNICAPSSEAKSIMQLYNQVGAVDNMFVFKIPVYQNMPEACPLPTESKKVVLNVLNGYSDNHIYLDGIAYEAQVRNGYYIVDANDFSAKIATMYKYNESGVPTGMAVWELSTNGKSYTPKRLTDFDDLLSYHGFSIRNTEKSGIRFKTGISEEKKASLLGGGLGGYKLKEYGTLVMTSNNRSKYPMIKDGEKAVSAMAYGINEKGALVDNVYETIDGRQRFTAVLTDVPTTQYKTEFAFRGYVVLTKSNQDVIVYGPIMHRSIYQLAQQALDLNLYESGTKENVFLNRIIEDGDKASQISE